MQVLNWKPLSTVMVFTAVALITSACSFTNGESSEQGEDGRINSPPPTRMLDMGTVTGEVSPEGNLISAISFDLWFKGHPNMGLDLTNRNFAIRIATENKWRHTGVVNGGVGSELLTITNMSDPQNNDNFMRVGELYKVRFQGLAVPPDSFMQMRIEHPNVPAVLIWNRTTPPQFTERVISFD